MPETRHIIVLLVGCVLIALILVSNSLPYLVEPVNPIVEPASPSYQIGAWFYLWYGHNDVSNSWTGGQGSSHWATADGITKTSSLGYYSSVDERVWTWQLGEMKQLGITFLIISWWGQSSYVNDATLKFLKYLDDNGLSMQIAIMIEPYGSVNYASDMNYIWELYNQYSDRVFKINGLPLLAFYNPLSPPQDHRFSIRIVGHGNVDWTYWQGMDALDDYGGSWAMPQVSQYVGNPKVSKDGVVCIIPRYDDYALYLAGSRPHYMRFGLDGTLWQKELAFAKAHAKIIVISTFNEYHENTDIEARLSELFD